MVESTTSRLSEEDLAENSFYSAMKRTKLSAPLRYIIGLKLGFGRVFHQGPGRRENPDRDKVRSIATSVIEYDPGYGPGNRSVLCKSDCDQAISIYVLNVLAPEARRLAISDMHGTLKRGSIAYVAVRSLSDITRSSENWQPYKDGYLVIQDGIPHFQRGFTTCQLMEELASMFGQVQAHNLGGYTLALAHKL